MYNQRDHTKSDHKIFLVSSFHSLCERTLWHRNYHPGITIRVNLYIVCQPTPTECRFVYETFKLLNYFLLAYNVKTNKYRGKNRKRNAAANHHANHHRQDLLTRMTNSSQHPPNHLNRLLERLTWINSMLKPSRKSRTTTNMGSEDEIIFIPDTEPDATADCVHQDNLNDVNIISTVEPTNGEPSTNYGLNY